MYFSKLKEKHLITAFLYFMNLNCLRKHCKHRMLCCTHANWLQSWCIW